MGICLQYWQIFTKVEVYQKSIFPSKGKINIKLSSSSVAIVVLKTKVLVSAEKTLPLTVSHSDEPEPEFFTASRSTGKWAQISLSACRPLFAISAKLNVKCSSLGHKVNDGLWHSVSLNTRNLQITLTVDGEPSSTIELWEQLESRGSFYFGG